VWGYRRDKYLESSFFKATQRIASHVCTRLHRKDTVIPSPIGGGPGRSRSATVYKGLRSRILRHKDKRNTALALVSVSESLRLLEHNSLECTRKPRWDLAGDVISIQRKHLSIRSCLHNPQLWYGVATASRLLKNIGLFCKRALQKRPVFCKETCIFKHPTHRSHPISLSTHA